MLSSQVLIHAMKTNIKRNELYFWGNDLTYADYKAGDVYNVSMIVCIPIWMIYKHTVVQCYYMCQAPATLHDSTQLDSRVELSWGQS